MSEAKVVEMAVGEDRTSPAATETALARVIEEPLVVGPPGPAEWRAMREQALAICATDFVPKDMRGKPEAVLAAILTGREMGLGPMAALQGIRIQDGKPAYDAELMRAIVRKRGHLLKVVEKTHQRCVLRGRRRDTGEEAEVTWTLEDAIVAGLVDRIDENGMPVARSQNNNPLAWEKYPRRMLFARATSELVGELFSDVLVGGSYTPEELGDAAEWDEPSDDPAERRGRAFQRIKKLIADGFPAEKAQEIAASLGVATMADADAEQAEAVADAIDQALETGEVPAKTPEQRSLERLWILARERWGDDAEAKVHATIAPVESTKELDLAGLQKAIAAVEDPEHDPAIPPAPTLADRITAFLAEAAWEPSEEDNASSGDPLEERRMTLNLFAEVAAERAWTDEDVKKLLGSRKRDTAKALAELHIADLRVASDALEAFLAKADE